MKNSFFNLPLTGLFVFLVSLISCYFLIFFLKKVKIVDTPNSRSNHVSLTPRGGGIAILFSLVIGVFFLNIEDISSIKGFIIPILSIIILSIVSFLDDMKGMSPLIRITLHFTTVSCTLVYCFNDFLFFYGYLSPVLDKISIIIIWVYFINAFNFMDGINGISFVETSTITIGIYLLSLIDTLPDVYGAYSFILFCAVSGFAYWNLIQGKIFLGDVGSVSLGFMLGGLLLKVYEQGFPFVALILPLYYIADTSITLLKRIFKKEKIWKAHSSHYYQIGYRGSQSLKKTLSIIAIGNLFLIFCALIFDNVIGYMAFPVVVFQIYFLKKIGTIKE
jgi:UDP-N-acetylmuramyl pentapeptide phosphotransferase/UDP-N-acetylglucosamine-1-phosphate transferase